MSNEDILKYLDNLHSKIVRSSFAKIVTKNEILALIECKKAAEKNRAKKPKHNGCFDDKGIWHEWNGINGKPYELCPNCETNLCCEMPYEKKPKYCVNCGQAIDWS